MKVLGIIPARIASTRLPRKPLQLLGGKPIIQHTYLGAKACTLIDRLIVATDSEEVARVVRDIGGEVVITDPALVTGSDRVAAVARELPEFDVVINIQGDEPFIEGAMLDRLLVPYIQGENPDMATIGYPLNFESAYHEPGNVKVIFDRHGYALYFSRAPIPYFRVQIDQAPVLHHMGIYAYRSDFLQVYTGLAQTPLEQAESLEQLRALENGYRIKVLSVPHGTLEINTPEELLLAEQRLRDRA